MLSPLWHEMVCAMLICPHTKLYFGRPCSYLKLKRGMPQTKWNDPKTGARIGGISLAERIEEVLLPMYGATECKFISGVDWFALITFFGPFLSFILLTC